MEYSNSATQSGRYALKKGWWLLPGVAVLLNAWMFTLAPHSTAIEWLLVARDLAIGKLPYRDAFLHVGPFTGILMGIFFWIFSASMWSASLFFFLVNLGTAWGIYQTSKLWLNRDLSIAAASLYLIVMPYFGGCEMFVEPVVGLLGIWGLFLILRPESKDWQFVLAIVLFAFAFLTKHTGLVFFGAWGLQTLVNIVKFQGAERNQELIRLFMGIAVFGIVFTLVAMSFYWIDAFGEFAYCFFIFNFLQEYYFSPRIFLIDLVLGVAPWIFFVGLAGLWATIKDDKPIPLMIIAVVPPILMHCFRVPFHHYFIVGIPCLLILAARGLSAVWKNKLALGLFLILCLPTLGRIGISFTRPFGVPDWFATVLKHTPFGAGLLTPNSVFTELEMSRTIKAALPPTKCLYSDYSLHYFYLDMAPPFNTDLLFEPGIVSSPKFKGVDTVIVHQPRENGKQAITRRPKYLTADFVGTDVPIEHGRVGAITIYHRELKNLK